MTAPPPKPEPGPISRELVEACYRTILGRAPENEAVVAGKVAGHAEFEALLREFLDSAEFKARIDADATARGRREALGACYRAILGRPPDGHEAVDARVVSMSDLQFVIEDLLESPEYKARLGLAIAGRPRPGVGDYLHEPPQQVDFDVTDDQLAELFERLREQIGRAS